MGVGPTTQTTTQDQNAATQMESRGPLIEVPQTPLPSHQLSTEPLSELYHYCRNNEFAKVNECIMWMSVNEINKLESNDSTALHVASYYGHEKIMKLLLDNGASRSIQNKYQLTAYDESKTNSLFERSSQNRFIGRAIEWKKVDPKKDEQHQRSGAYWAGKSESTCDYFDSLRNDALSKHPITYMSWFYDVKWFLDKAIENNDVTYIIRAYTAETQFCRQFYKDMIMNRHPTETEDIYNIFRYKRTSLSFNGQTYRAMLLTKDEILQYNVRSLSRIRTKTFLSTTKNREIAKKVINEYQSQNDNWISALCTFKLTGSHTSLDLEQISEYKYEQEVLILYDIAFDIVTITENHNGLEIELEECPNYAWWACYTHN